MCIVYCDDSSKALLKLQNGARSKGCEIKRVRDKITGLFCRISSLLYGSFAKETHDFIDPTNQSHPIRHFSSFKRVRDPNCCVPISWPIFSPRSCTVTNDSSQQEQATERERESARARAHLVMASCNGNVAAPLLWCHHKMLGFRAWVLRGGNVEDLRFRD